MREGERCGWGGGGGGVEREKFFEKEESNSKRYPVLRLT